MGEAQIDYDSMSDEEFGALNVEDIPLTEGPVEVADGDDAGGEVSEEVVAEAEAEADEVDGPGESDEDSEDSDEGDTPDEDGEDDGEAGSDDGEVDGDRDAEDSGDQDADDEGDEANDGDFKARYEEVMAPIKANGEMVELESVDDLRRLASMGLGYSEKMRRVKGPLKIVKSLKDNGLLDEGRLDLMIEASKGDPKAIAKLVKESGIDPLDMDTEGAGDYEPKKHEVSDSEYDLDQAIDEIRGKDGFEESMDIMGEQWDSKSRELIAENPQIVSIVHDHVQSGVFKAIQTKVTTERALGRLEGLSDVEAYRVAAEAMVKSGVLTKGGERADEGTDDSGDALKREAEAKKVAKVKAKRDAKRKAAAPVKGRKAEKTGPRDLSGLSDEEFLKEFDKL